MVATKKAKGKATGKSTRTVVVGAVNVSPQNARQLLQKFEGSAEGANMHDRLLLLHALPHDPNGSSSAPSVAASKDPNHLADLIPAHGSYRMTGIWKKNVEAVLDTGDDICVERRAVSATPAGLSNLGNTCYVNAALQALFTCAPFRAAICNIEASVVEADASGLLKELRQLFLNLQFGLTAAANPVRFVDCLQLQYGEQQDAQEFQKLLMQALETRMGASAKPEVRSFYRPGTHSTQHSRPCQLCYAQPPPPRHGPSMAVQYQSCRAV